MSAALRPYQTEAVAAVLAEWETERSTLLVMPTGTGKTVAFGAIAAARRSAGRTLILAHREELLDQARHRLMEDFGLTAQIEQAHRRAIRDEDMYGHGVSAVVVGSVPTMRGGRLETWPRDAFATIIVDEAHHAAAPTYRDILEHFEGAKVLGVTATPDRGDEVGLGTVFGSAAYIYSIWDAVQDGWLVPVKQKLVHVEGLDLSRVKTVTGDLAQGELQAALEVDEVHHQIASPLKDLAETRTCLLFCAGVEQSKQLAAVLAGYLGADRVAQVDGETPREDREWTLRRFKDGDIRVLCNVMVLTEGFDAPECDCVVMARPTKSRALYAQMLGRGTRPLPGVVDPHPEAADRRASIARSAKPDLLVLDFVGNAGRHKLVNAADVLAGRELPDAIRAAAQERMEDGEAVHDAIAHAEAAALAAEQREQEERRRRSIQVGARYATEEVSPFGLLDTRDPGRVGADASAKQRELLERWGVKVDPAKPLSQRQASAIIGKLIERRESGLATYKQSRLLAKHGLRTDVPFDTASKIIDYLSARGWKATPQLLAKYGAPRRTQEAAE